MSNTVAPGVPLIEVISVAFQRYGPLKVFVQSWLNQTADNWCLRVIHDGPDMEFVQIMSELAAQSSGRITFSETDTRYNDYGHTLRDLGLQSAHGDYVLLTNGDNYYVPKCVEYLTEAAQQSGADVLLFDMIHSHDRPGGRPMPAYSYFQTQFSRLNIDIGAALVRTAIARAAGFRDRTHDGDASYFEDVARVNNGSVSVCKIPRVLLVHN
ncbi:hypothetical protein SBBP1_1150006 [Burkholderiales bacterium]|nr:hypothetical protein SBBP1_1150006 [Burkholderiales bacterium]